MEGEIDGAKDRENGSSKKPERRSLVRKRPVSFGISRNYHGNVYTVPGTENSIDDDSTLQSSLEEHRRIVAMIGVPPEHVPEGILNLIRSYRPFVEHVRVVIADSDGEEEGKYENENDQGRKEGDEKEEIHNVNMNTLRLDDDDDETTAKLRRDRTYLILVQLCREEDAATFVEDLDGKPYIAFDDRETCQIERVVGVETTATIPGTDKQAQLPKGKSDEGPQQQNEGTLQDVDNQSLPLLQPSFETSVFDWKKGEGSSFENEESMGGQKGSSIRKCLNIPANRDDSTMNCAVCLEDLGLEEKKMDDRSALLATVKEDCHAACIPVPTTSTRQPSLLTTVCNHTFHLGCLEQCTGPCPVCRYDHSGLNETLSQCHVCGTTERNYVCLICGVVSCGIPHTAEAVPPAAAAAASSSSSTTTSATPRFSSHAGKHYHDTLHAYALDTETQHVYDFCGQGYVHRLVQNKEDGKLVEVNAPTSVARSRTPGERSWTPGLSDSQEGEVVHRKLEGAAEQYNNLLKSQLEKQRAFFEKRLNEMRREFSVEHQRAKAQDLLSVLKQERKQVTQRLTSLQRRKAKVDETMAFLANMNESVESNKVALSHKIEKAAWEQNTSKEKLEKKQQLLEVKLDKLMERLTGSMED